MRPLQRFNFKESFYERPNQKWICGRTDCGASCLVGPTDQGLCRATSECRPLKKGDHWHCTRPAALGGPCSEGPLPQGNCARPIPKCTPKRSLRSWRYLTTVSVVALTLGGLSLMLASRRGPALLSAGELSFQHSSSESQCSDCHQNMRADTPVADWLQAAPPSHPMGDSPRCLTCHDLGADPFAPHSTPPEALRASTETASVGGRPPLRLALASLVGGGSSNHSDGLTCATCHREHQGKAHDLARLSNAQCQSCHSVQFASLAQGHPDFGDYPFRRRTRIVFDHRSHLQTHFNNEQYKEGAPDSCLVCHTPDSTGRTILVNDFSESCAACHQDQIRGKGRAGSQGIAVFQLPGIDILTLEDKELDIGQWPEFAEGKVTPFMKLLLSHDPETRALLDRVGDADLLDLLDAEEPVLQDTVKLVWTVKNLLFDLSAQGHAGWEGHLQKALQTNLTADQLAPLVGLLSQEILQAAAQAWFPNLKEEIEAHRAGQDMPEKTEPAPSKTPPLSPEEWVARGGWYRSDQDYSISYRPSGHGDVFIRSWLDLTAGSFPAGRAAAEPRPSNPAADLVLQTLADPKGPGLCTKCHSIDAAPQPRVNWLAPRPDPLERGFTRFSHVSHFSLLNDQGCLQCHSMRTEADATAYGAAFAPGQRDPAVFHSNFDPLKRETCASCHTAHFAGDSCLSCHNYHIGHFRSTLLNTNRTPAAGATP